MHNSNHLVSYPVFKIHKEVLAFTTTQKTLGIQNVRFSNEPANKNKLADVLGLAADKLVFPSQTHTNCVVQVDQRPQAPINDTDALITNKPGLCICVQTADCVPILLFDPEKHVIAAIHAGWRGTVEKIVEVALSKMTNNYACNPENILAAIGPSISPEIYEVGDEVVQAARLSIPNVDETLRKNGSGKFHFNLWEANRQLLLAAGLAAKNIEILGECSFRENEKYYSARRDGINTGRMVSGIMIL